MAKRRPISLRHRDVPIGRFFLKQIHSQNLFYFYNQRQLSMTVKWRHNEPLPVIVTIWGGESTASFERIVTFPIDAILLVALLAARRGEAIVSYLDWIRGHLRPLITMINSEASSGVARDHTVAQRFYWEALSLKLSASRGKLAIIYTPFWRSETW